MTNLTSNLEMATKQQKTVIHKVLKENHKA